MKGYSIFTVCVFTLITTISVFAQDPQGQQAPRRRGSPEKRIKQFDVNNDGAISRDEWKGNSRAFDRIDKNGDGSLTREELTEAASRHSSTGKRPGLLKQMDTNNDNQISREEWKGDERRFGRLDVNSEGVITKEEIQAVRNNRKKAN